MSISVITSVWKHSAHKGSALLTLLAIADNANDNGYCWPGLDVLAEKTRQNRVTVIRLIRQLETSGELIVHRNRRRGNRYLVTVGFSPEHVYQQMRYALHWTDEQIQKYQNDTYQNATSEVAKCNIRSCKMQHQKLQNATSEVAPVQHEPSLNRQEPSYNEAPGGASECSPSGCGSEENQSPPAAALPLRDVQKKNQSSPAAPSAAAPTASRHRRRVSRNPAQPLLRVYDPMTAAVAQHIEGVAWERMTRKTEQRVRDIIAEIRAREPKDAPITPEDLDGFQARYKEQFPDAALPRDPVKIARWVIELRPVQSIAHSAVHPFEALFAPYSQDELNTELNVRIFNAAGSTVVTMPRHEYLRLRQAGYNVKEETQDKEFLFHDADHPTAFRDAGNEQAAIV